MAIRITTQKQMLERRRALCDCYICGRALPPKGPGWKSQIVGEHVVPRTLLGQAPANAADRWAVELNVHKACEERHKSHRDQLAKLLHVLATMPAEQWCNQDAGLLAREFGVATHARDGAEPVFAITEIESAMLSPVLWMRGMHAALYGAVLPGNLGFVIHPPVPVWKAEERVEDGLHNDELRERCLLGLLRVAIHTNRVDEIRAWGGKVVYRCAWQEALLKRGGDWGCTWALEFPGVREWALRVCGVDRPWHGYYEVPVLAPGASVVGQTEIDEWNRYAEARKDEHGKTQTLRTDERSGTGRRDGRV